MNTRPLTGCALAVWLRIARQPASNQIARPPATDLRNMLIMCPFLFRVSVVTRPWRHNDPGWLRLLRRWDEGWQLVIDAAKAGKEVLTNRLQDAKGKPVRSSP